MRRHLVDDEHQGEGDHGPGEDDGGQHREGEGPHVRPVENSELKIAFSQKYFLTRTYDSHLGAEKKEEKCFRDDGDVPDEVGGVEGGAVRHVPECVPLLRQPESDQTWGSKIKIL